MEQVLEYASLGRASRHGDGGERHIVPGAGQCDGLVALNIALAVGRLAAMLQAERRFRVCEHEALVRSPAADVPARRGAPIAAASARHTPSHSERSAAK